MRQLYFNRRKAFRDLSSNTLILNGSSQYVDIAADSSLDTNLASYSIWALLDSGVVGTGGLRIWDRVDGSNNRFLMAWQSATGKMRLLIKTGTGSQVFGDSSTTFSQDTFNHLLVTYDGSNCKLFFNGNSTPEVNLSTSGNWWTTSSLTRIGADDTGGQEWEGNIAQAIIFDANMESSLSELYNSGNPLKYANYSSTITNAATCALELAEDQPSAGQEYTDQTSNTNDGTANGSPVFGAPTLTFG